MTETADVSRCVAGARSSVVPVISARSTALARCSPITAVIAVTWRLMMLIMDNHRVLLTASAAAVTATAPSSAMSTTLPSAGPSGLCRRLLGGPPLGDYISIMPVVRLSVSLVATVNSKTENRTTFKRREEVIRFMSNWQSNFEVKRSKVKVTAAGKGRVTYRVGHWGRSSLLVALCRRTLSLVCLQYIFKLTRPVYESTSNNPDFKVTSSRYYLTSKNAKMVQDRATVTMADQ